MTNNTSGREEMEGDAISPPSISSTTPQTNSRRTAVRRTSSYRPQWELPFAGYATQRHPSAQLSIHNNLVVAVGEFIGTFMFLLFAFLGHSMAVASAPTYTPGSIAPTNDTVIYIALSYGLGLLVTAWTLYRVTGGLFNPAVTLALTLTGNLPWVRGAIFVPVQMLGAMAAAGVVRVIIPGKIVVVHTALGPGVSVVQGLFIEMVSCEFSFLIPKLTPS
jgi:aquaporin related protein